MLDRWLSNRFCLLLEKKSIREAEAGEPCKLADDMIAFLAGDVNPLVDWVDVFICKPFSFFNN